MKVKIVVDVAGTGGPKGWFGLANAMSNVYGIGPGYVVYNGDLPTPPLAAGSKRYYLTAELPNDGDRPTELKQVGEVFEEKR